MELISIKDILKILGIKSKQTIYTYIKDRDFPVPKKVSLRVARWEKGDVLSWIEKQSKESK